MSEKLEENKTNKGEEVLNTEIPKTDKPAEEVVEEIVSTKPAKSTAKGTKPKTEKPAEEVKPKETKLEKLEKVEEVKKDPVMDFEIDSEKTYKFVTSKPGFRQMIPSTAVVWDEVNACPKDIKLTDTEESPYVEDQSESSKTTRKQLAFINGVLLIKGTNVPAIRYLMAYDGFAGKGNIMPANRKIKNMYSLEVEEDLQGKLIAREKLKQEARAKILEADLSNVESFLLTRDKTTTGSAALVEALKIADIAPEVILNNFDNPLVELKASLIRAKFKGLLSVVDNSLQDSSGRVLFTAIGRDVLEEVAKEIYTETDKGKELSKLLV